MPNLGDLICEELRKSFRELKNRIVRCQLEVWLLQKEIVDYLVQRLPVGIFCNLSVEGSHLCSIDRVAQLPYSITRNLPVNHETHAFPPSLQVSDTSFLGRDCWVGPWIVRSNGERTTRKRCLTIKQSPPTRVVLGQEWVDIIEISIVSRFSG